MAGAEAEAEDGRESEAEDGRESEAEGVPLTTSSKVLKRPGCPGTLVSWQSETILRWIVFPG